MAQNIETQLVDSGFQAQKVFCIGFLKTGTTSLEQALKDLGYRLGSQHQGELLLKAYVARDFKRIVEFCLTADAFQDIPFCFPFTFVALDQSFPNAKFILSVRDDSDQWYRSLVRFHGNAFAGGRVPVKDDLIRAASTYPGFIWDVFRLVWNAPDDDPYYKPLLVSRYERHNADVRDYFRSKSNLLEVNLSEKGAYEKFCKFLGKEPAAEDFPRLNASSPLTNENALSEITNTSAPNDELIPVINPSPANIIPKISVLLVTYNHEKYIRQALDSVMMQNTNFDFEILIADDCSADKTTEIAREYEAVYPNVRLLPTTQHLGITRNYQRAFAASRGEYVAVLEGDDYWISPTKLKFLSLFLDQHDECAFCFHRVIRLDEVSEEEKALPLFEGRNEYQRFTARDLAKLNFITGLSACFYRRSLIAEVDPEMWKLKFREWPFNIVIAQHGLIGYIPEILSVYRAHPGGISSRKTAPEQAPMLLEIVDSYNKYLNFKFDAEFQEFKKSLSGAVRHAEAVSRPVRVRHWIKPFVPPIVLTLFRKMRQATSAQL
jgi:glycosyltransferase involved in cell wall biosynthesis